jgi:hypothetical protein
MRLETWVDRHIQNGTHKTREAVIEDLARRSRVSKQTLKPTIRGMLLGNYTKARQVSEATGWAVSIPELCDKDPNPVLEAIRVATCPI